MDDVRQTLLPTFLKEVQAKLPVLDAFLLARKSKDCDLLALDAAFRAIHTIKGTAGLLKANSVRGVAERVESLLDKHLIAKSSPSQAEYDVLTFAYEQLPVLVDYFKDSQPAPAGMVEGVHQALDLVEAFPGQSGSVTKSGNNLLNEDPFAEDSAFDQAELDEVASPATSSKQPIQDSATKQAPKELPTDPFAEDHRFGLSDSDNIYAESDGNTVEKKYVDPFAEDPDFEPVIPSVSD